MALERKQRDAFTLGEGFDLGDELAGDLSEQSGRGDGIAAMLREKTHQAGAVLQMWHVAVEVEAVNGFELEGDMALEQIMHIDRSRWHKPEYPPINPVARKSQIVNRKS